MQKLVLFLTIGILTFSLGGCGSTEDVDDNEPETIEETTPAETEDGDEVEDGDDDDDDDEDDDDDDEQSQLEEFKDPLVEERQKNQAAADAGLIQSTKAEERLLQLKGSSNGTPVATATTARPNDPFSVLPPLVVQGTPDQAEEAAEITRAAQLNARQVPDLPSLPVAAAPPAFGTRAVTVANNTPPQTTTTGGGNQTTPGGNQTTPGGNQTTTGGNQATVATSLPPAQIPALPELPVAPVPPSTVASIPGLPSVPGFPSAPNGSSAAGSPSAPGSPSESATPVVPTPPAPPPLEVAAIPQLPELPISEAPQAWIDPNPPVADVPPPPPSTTLAEAVAVTGVVRTGSSTRVILKAPREATSRYVTVGQTIANGQVLVKRVKFSQGSDPIVIFEQNGVEVAVEVGSVPQTEEELNNMVPPPPSINAFNQV
ncbi:MAG: hypothetical protein WBA13_04610 [Microcoleaceae cyanobacterium]